MVESAIITAIREYMEALGKAGIHVRKSVLFGSYARGEADRWSDIDLIVIAPEFDAGKELELVEMMWQMRIMADNRIEPIACGEKEWETDERRPVLEIARREGVVVNLRGGAEQ